MKIERYTIDTFHLDFPDDDTCLDYMFNLAYGNLPACPQCGVVEPRYYRVRGRKCYACNDCGYQISPLANTIFHKSETPLTKWFYAIYLFSVGKNGVSAKEIERHLGVTYKTAWRMAKQIRLMMQQGGIAPLSGIVEADETYIGGKTSRERNPHIYDKKTAVIGIVEKQKGIGKVKAIATKSANATNTLPFLRDNIVPGSILQTDESRICAALKVFRLDKTLGSSGEGLIPYLQGDQSFLKRLVKINELDFRSLNFHFSNDCHGSPQARFATGLNIATACLKRCRSTPSLCLIEKE